MVVEDLKGLKEEDGQASSLLSFMTSGRQHKSKVKDAIRELDTSNNLFIFQTEALDRYRYPLLITWVGIDWAPLPLHLCGRGTLMASRERLEGRPFSLTTVQSNRWGPSRFPSSFRLQRYRLTHILPSPLLPSPPASPPASPAAWP